MKIVAGLGSVDEYIRFCEAGADEFFAGYVPYDWNRKYGTMLPLNRREVLCSNVQLGAFSELEILAAMVRKYKRLVHLTFNALYYIPQQYPEIARIVTKCMELGFQSFILADPALICYLRQNGIGCEIHLSGETSEVNSRMFSVFQEQEITRLIFHRKNSFSDMKRVVENGRQQGKTLEYEAFVLNELCQFSGAFCNSLHCDEMGYLCRVPYRLGTVMRKNLMKAGETKENRLENQRNWQRAENAETTENPAKRWKWDVQERKMGENGGERNFGIPEPAGQHHPEEAYTEDGYLCGATGCGLCALYQLQKAGITHVKLVGRGNYVDFMERDIRNLKRALKILEESCTEEQYQKRMKQTLFPCGCSGNCYYR